ncbi:MAG: tetratricopeptide repeat protein [Bdellovibrionales bacterium]|nr:tetratricopeptide repeat protein [Bdellovibrionales bacterium]
MLEHKVVTKIELLIRGRRRGFLFPGAMLFAFISNFCQFAVGAPSERAPAEAGKVKTVGDVLRKIEGKNLSIKKGDSKLPQFQEFESRKQTNLQAVKPPSSTSLYYEEGSEEAVLEKVTDDGIDQLFKLTNKFKSSKKRGELWLRLAELYVEKSRLIEFRLHQEFDRKIRESKEGSPKQKLNLGPAQEYNRKAVQLYEWFLRDFPTDEKVDQALFFLGFNYFELNDEKKGMSYYQRLTKEFPKSPFVDESNFAIGEFHFENERWSEALPHYQQVANNRRARLFSFALYKSAWCQYKVGSVKEALQSLERVIKAGRMAKSQEEKTIGGVSRIRLATEALKDLVIFYAEVGSYKAAKDYFAQVAGPKNVNSLQEKLAYYYADMGQRTGARFTFHELIEANQSAPKAYDYQYQIVTMYAATGEAKIFKQELYNWIQGYGPDSAWQKTNGRNRELIAKATQLIETTLRNYILQQHQTAQNSRAPNAQAMAKSGYELYFRVFKDSPKLDEMHFFFAELLFDIEEYERASDHYLWVAENAPNSAYFDKSVLNAILSLEKKLPTSEEVKKIVGGTTSPVEFDSTIKKFEKVVLRFLKDFPKGPDSIAIKYRLGALYYYYNQFDRALLSFQDIIKTAPNTKFAEYSANLTLDIYNLKNDYEGLEKAGQEILSIPQLAASPVGSQVQSILEKSSFKRAQNMEAEKDFLSSAKQFESFSNKNARSELATSARFNSAVNYERAGDLLKALAMYGSVLKGSGKGHEALKQKSLKFMALLYEKSGQYKEAAEFFEKYANENAKGDKDAVDFFYNAGVIRDGMNFFNAALDNYQKYFDRSKRRDRMEVIFLMAKIWQKRGNLKNARSYYSQYVDLNPANASALIEALFQLGVIEEKLGRQKASDDYFKRTVAVQKGFSKNGTPVGVAYAAEAQFKIIYRVYDELRSIKIPADPSGQDSAVRRKLDLISKLKERLKEVIKYDDAYMVVAALTLSGQANQHMSAALYSVALPSKLSPDQLKEYKAGVDKVARPFQDEALSNYTAAIEKGYRLEGYNEWLKAAFVEANRLNSEKFPNFGEEAILTKLPDYLEN